MRTAPQEIRTFFVSSVLYNRQRLFARERFALCFLDALQHYRKQGRFLLHAFVLMPDHMHLIVMPHFDVSLERAMQFVKGGFSFRAKRELSYSREVWQPSFNEHRIKDRRDFAECVRFVHQNPVRRGLCSNEAQYPYSSAKLIEDVDPAPEHLRG